MASSRTTEEILAAWQASVESDQETGALSSLSLGESDSLVDALPGLTACRRFALTRSDVAVPWILAGGGSALWFCLAVHFGKGHDGSPSTSSAVDQPTLMPFYTGPDSATIMASTTLQRRFLYRHDPRRSQTAPDGLPAGMVSLLAPMVQPGIVEPWESLPFAIMEPEPAVVEDDPVDWSAYAALFLAVCLVLVALLL